MVVPANATQQT